MKPEFTPDINAIRQHIEFITQGMSDYSDGLIEIAYGDENNVPRNAEKFSFEELEKAALFAAEKNAAGRNIYIVGSVLSPDCPPFGRCSDDDFYASSVVWCDIDKFVRPDELKELYKNLPPSVVVVTGRTPHLRMHLWWKLAEPVTDADTLREGIMGVLQHLGGDPAVHNPSRLMRLAGTIAWPKKEGRITEKTEFITPINHTPATGIEKIIAVYPANYIHAENITPHEKITVISKENPFAEKLADGRDRYMSDVKRAPVAAGGLGAVNRPSVVKDLLRRRPAA